jgi:hypothetical protein
MLIIEGTDHVGKTTLAKKLVAELDTDGYTYRHLTRLTAGFDRYWDYLPMMTKKVVMDRFFLSEIAYQRAREEKFMTIGTEELRLLNAKLALFAGYTVVVTCDNDLLAERYAQEEGAEHQMYKMPVVLAANVAFRSMVDSPSYGIDCHIPLDKDYPWPSNGDVKSILMGYRNRLAAMSSLMRRKSQTFSKM